MLGSKSAIPVTGTSGILKVTKNNVGESLHMRTKQGGTACELNGPLLDSESAGAFISGVVAPRSMRNKDFLFVSHLVYATLLQWPKQSKALSVTRPCV